MYVMAHSWCQWWCQIWYCHKWSHSWCKIVRQLWRRSTAISLSQQVLSSWRKVQNGHLLHITVLHSISFIFFEIAMKGRRFVTAVLGAICIFIIDFFATFSFNSAGLENAIESNISWTMNNFKIIRGYETSSLTTHNTAQKCDQVCWVLEVKAILKITMNLSLEFQATGQIYLIVDYRFLEAWINCYFITQ